MLALSLGCDVYSSQFLPSADAGRDTGRPDSVVDTGSSEDALDASIDAPEDSDVLDVMDASDADTSDATLDTDVPRVSRQPPPRPELEDSGTTELVFAVRDVALDQRDGRWVEYGYNLDGATTTLEDPDSPCDAVRVVPDGEGGVDNVLGAHILPFFLDAYPELQTFASDGLQDGRRSLVVRIRGYNGELDDPRVEVGVVQSVGIAREPGGPATTPGWDGEDYLIINERDFVDGDPDRPRLFDDNAYIAGGVLVMRPPPGRTLELPWSEFGLQLSFSDTIVTAELDLDEGRVDNMIFAGRWGLVDFSDALTSGGICPGTDERFFADAMLRRYADVRSVPGSGGPGVECDAISAGLGFSGVFAHWDRLEAGELIPLGCE